MEENFEKQSHGLFIPNELLERKDLKPLELLIWATIHAYTRWAKGKACWLTNEDLAKQWGCSIQSISDYIAHLKKLGFIEQVSFNGRRRVLRSVLSKVYENS
jgi:predicted transcriptional regulator